jgi:hypothetical protein
MATTLYANTTTLEARSLLTVENQKKFELRPVLSRVAEPFIRSANAAIVNLAQIKKAVQQTTKVIYHKNKAFTINSSRSNTPTGEQSGTGISTITWYEKNFRVTDSSKLFQNNDVDRMTALAVNLWNGEKSFWESLDENVLVAFLDSNKSTVNDGHTYDGTLASGVMTIKADDVDKFYNIVAGHMGLNDFEAPFMDIHSMYWKSKQQYYAAQGAGNNTNLAFQFGGFEHFPSNKITPTAGNYISKHYIVPVGGIAMVTWNNPDNRSGVQHANARLFTVESLFYPGIYFDVFAYDTWGDTSSGGSGEITGDLQDATTCYEYCLHYANWTHPFTESGQTAIFRYDNKKEVVI